MRWLWRQHLLRTLVGLIAVCNLIFAALTLVIIVRARDLGASAAEIGLLLGSYGVGGLIGALVAPSAQRRVAPNVILLGSLWLGAGQLLLYTLAPNLVVLGVAALLGSLTWPVFNVVVAAYRYALTPDRLQGRVGSVARLVAWGTIPIGALLGGLSVERFGAVQTFAGLTVLGVGCALAGSATAQVRRAPRVETLDQP